MRDKVLVKNCGQHNAVTFKTAIPSEWVQMWRDGVWPQCLWPPPAPLGLSVAGGERWPAAASRSDPEESR